VFLPVPVEGSDCVRRSLLRHRLQPELWDFEQLPVFQGGLVGNDACDSHVKSARDIDDRQPILEDRSHELVH